MKVLSLVLEIRVKIHVRLDSAAAMIRLKRIYNF
jgi:hypothetical protein